MHPPSEQLVRDYLNGLSVAAASRLGPRERQQLLDRPRARIEAADGAQLPAGLARPQAVPGASSTAGSDSAITVRTATRSAQVAAARSGGQDGGAEALDSDGGSAKPRLIAEEIPAQQRAGRPDPAAPSGSLRDR